MTARFDPDSVAEFIGIRTAFVKLIRARFDSAAKKTANEGDKLRERPDYLRRHWGEVLRTLYAAQ